MSTTLRLEIGGGDMEKKYGRSLKDTHIVEDPMTGEVLEVSERIRGSFSPYVMVFDQGMKALASLKDAPHGLVMAVIHRMSYANNCQRVELPVAVQKEIAAAYGVSDRTLRRLVSSMEQDGILLREGILSAASPAVIRARAVISPALRRTVSSSKTARFWTS